MYIQIQNPVETPVEFFYILGASTSRGEEGKIGQFGTGAKHACLTLLREEVDFCVYSGTKKITFQERDLFLANKLFHTTICVIDGVEKECGFTSEFGAIDWTCPTMAIREFICNAMDNGGVKYSIVNEPVPTPGCTTVYIAYERFVRTYFENISKFILDEKPMVSRLWRHENGEKARIYRRGIFIQDVFSYFSYNFEKLDITESRTAVISSLEQAICDLVGSSIDNVMQFVDNSLNYKDGEIESILSSYNFHKSEAWDLFVKRYSDYVFLRRSELSVVQVHNLSRYRVVSGPIYNFLTRVYNVQTIKNLDVSVRSKMTIVPVPEAVRAEFDMVWLALSNLTTKDQPALRCFERHPDSEMILGMHDNGTVYLEINDGCNVKTMVEEIAHYLSGAADATRRMQECLLSIIVHLYRKG